MASGKNQALKIIASLALIFCASGFALSAQIYQEAIVSAFFSVALASVIVLHLRVRPAWQDALLILAGTALLGLVDFVLLKYPRAIMAWPSFAGLMSLLVLGIRAVWAEGESRKPLIYAWVPAVLFVSSEWFASTLLDWTTAAHPKTLDLYLFSFDSSMRVQLSFLVARWFWQISWLRLVGMFFYLGLPIAIALVYAGQLVRKHEKAFPAMLAFLFAGPVGALFYNLFPAVSPKMLFARNFPFNPLPAAQVVRLFLEPIPLQGPRNAMPSLHLAWTLLAWWYSRGLSWWERAIAFAFLAFTALATLGSGEHYFIDLIVAFPFALMMEALCEYSLSYKDPRRLAAFLFGIIVTLGWFAALRYFGKFFWTSPLIPWSLAAATVALTILRHREFRRAVDFSESAADPQPELALVASEISTAGR
jgi:PAP2 superfamily